MSKIIFAYIVCKNKAEAKRIGQVLVKERLAACVNILDNMTSIYRWKGKIEQTKETVLIAKTTQALFEKLSLKIKLLHSYTIPCIAGFAISKGNKKYFKWLEECVKPLR